jgi:hypothetical protein
MVEVIGVLTAAFVVALLIALATGRARVSTCCRYIPPAEDPRLRDAPRADSSDVTS